MSSARSSLSRGLSLFVVSAIDMGGPLIRMLILSHVLSLKELGFTSAIQVTLASIWQITDFALYRFVLSTPREGYQAALAAAHGLAITRGVTVGLCAIVLSPFIAAFFSVPEDWPSFAGLAAVQFAAGFIHLSPQVSERDYNYVPQLLMNISGLFVGLLVLSFCLWIGEGHYAFLISIIAQYFVVVAMSHLVTDQPYRVAFLNKDYRRAWTFGYPLIINGIGLAFSSQGDRFLVGYFLGVPALGLYNVVMLATYVPMALALKVMNVVSTAWLFNAIERIEAFRQRLTLASWFAPFVAAIYASGIILLFDELVPLVFGAKFRVAPGLYGLFAFAAYARITRIEPTTSLLIAEGRTRRLAAMNLTVIAGLAASMVVMYFFRDLGSAAVGRLIGETASFAVGLALTRQRLGPVMTQTFLANLFGIGTVVASEAIYALWPPASHWWGAVAALLVVSAPMGIVFARLVLSSPEFRRIDSSWKKGPAEEIGIP